MKFRHPRGLKLSKRKNGHQAELEAGTLRNKTSAQVTKLASPTEVSDDVDEMYHISVAGGMQFYTSKQESSEQNITVISLESTPVEVFLRSFRENGSEFISSVYL